MTPILFGKENRRLFGILHPRSATAAPARGVLLCAALGREAIRAHRIYRVLAERLSRAGCDVLRFDYFGAGDSAGDSHEADLDGWSEDLLEAHAELVRRAGVTSVCWLGMRIGTAVAQLASRRAPAELRRLVLWDPVADGRDYLDLLRVRHIEWAASNEGLTEPVAPVFRSQPDYYIDEAIGSAISRQLCDQLRALRLVPEGDARIETHVVSDPSTEEGRLVASICAKAPGAVKLVEVAHGTDWTGESDSTGLVPAPAAKILVDLAGSAA